METLGKFISSHPLIGTHQHQHFPTGNVVPIHQNKVKVRRTYGWLCPFDEYKSNKWFNTQRHINSQHGWGSGVPVDSRTGETREEKVRNAITQSNLPNTLTTFLLIRILVLSGQYNQIRDLEVVTRVRNGIKHLHPILWCLLPMKATLECRFLSPRREEFGSLDTVADIHVTLRLGLRTITMIRLIE